MVFSRSAIVRISPTRVLIGAALRLGRLVGQPPDRGDVGGDAEQAGTRLVVQLVGDLPALVLLHGDEVAIEAAVLRPRLLQRFGQRVEALRR